MPVITAARTFYPGEVVHREEPFVEVLCTKYKDKSCGSCYVQSDNLKSCKQCSAVKYCGKICQEKNWNNHRLECRYMRNLANKDILELDAVRVTGLVILKIKGKDWKTIKTSVLGTDISFDDIGPHLEEISEDHLQNLRNKQMKEHVRIFIGDENMPHNDEFRIIFEKISQNLIACKAGDGCEIITFSIGISAFHHECIPNCNFTERRSSFYSLIWAMKEIKESEKLSICRRGINALPITRRFGATCKCTDCSLPYGESVLSKLIDENRAFDIIIRTQEFLAMWNYSSFSKDLPVINKIVDDLLEKQEVVLGNTHGLYLKLLTIKCFELGGYPLEMKTELIKLEKSLITVFGEYFEGLIEVYKGRVDISNLLGDVPEGSEYTGKLDVLLKLHSQ